MLTSFAGRSRAFDDDSELFGEADSAENDSESEVDSEGGGANTPSPSLPYLLDLCAKLFTLVLKNTLTNFYNDIHDQLFMIITTFCHTLDSAVIGDHCDIWLLGTFVNSSASILIYIAMGHVFVYSLWEFTGERVKLTHTNTNKPC